MVSERIAGRVALIVGASSGIGEAAALALARNGASVVLAARRRDRLERIAARIREEGGIAQITVTDITDEAQTAAMVDFALETNGHLDILLNAAGIGVAASFAATKPDESRRMVEVNLMGFLNCLSSSVPVFRRQGNGHVVVISSGAGRYFHPSVVYSGTKHAVSAIAESLRREIGKDGIRVTCIDPGAVKSEFLSHMRPEIQRAVTDRLGTMEQLQGDDIANAVIYAVSQPKHVNVNILTIYPTEQA
ncbi:NADP-dependent 3-hydroxy acid dehydrogenase YdfG [Sphingomonas sp. UYAg733]